MEGLFLSSRECGITAHVLKLSGIHSLFFLYYKHSCLFIVISEYICKDTEKRSSLRSKIQDMLPSLFRHSERKRRISYHHPVILSVSEESPHLSFQCKTDIPVCYFLLMFDLISKHTFKTLWIPAIAWNDNKNRGNDRKNHRNND